MACVKPFAQIHSYRNVFRCIFPIRIWNATCMKATSSRELSSSIPRSHRAFLPETERFQYPTILNIYTVLETDVFCGIKIHGYTK